MDSISQKTNEYANYYTTTCHTSFSRRCFIYVRTGIGVRVRAHTTVLESPVERIHIHIDIEGYEQVLYSLFILANGQAPWMSDTSYGNCFYLFTFFLLSVVFFLSSRDKNLPIPFAVVHSSATRDIFRPFSWNSIKVCRSRCENHNSRSFVIYYIRAICITVCTCSDTKMRRKKSWEAYGLKSLELDFSHLKVILQWTNHVCLAAANIE